MKLKNIVITTSLLLGLGAVSAYTFGDTEREWRFASEDVPPVRNADYVAECGSCHFAYQPGLLPASSWQKLMSGLDDHFGENAELSAEVRDTLTQYLLDNSAEKSAGWIARRITDSVPAGQTPERITELPFIVRKHDEIPARMIRDNPEVLSLSQCAACHTEAKRGTFDEHTVRIPGYGFWED